MKDIISCKHPDISYDNSDCSWKCLSCGVQFMYYHQLIREGRNEMKKMYSVEENKKIENGKSRIVNPELDAAEGVYENEDLPNKEEVDQPVKTFGSSVSKAPEYRPAEPKDIIYDNMIQIRSDKDPYFKDIRVVTVLNPSDSFKAFIGNDGKTYGLEFSFVKVKK